jgi:hypothetical protein
MIASEIAQYRSSRRADKMTLCGTEAIAELRQAWIDDGLMEEAFQKHYKKQRRMGYWNRLRCSGRLQWDQTEWLHNNPSKSDGKLIKAGYKREFNAWRRRATRWECDIEYDSEIDKVEDHEEDHSWDPPALPIQYSPAKHVQAQSNTKSIKYHTKTYIYMNIQSLIFSIDYTGHIPIRIL